jgi:hypothetical protein
MYSDRADTHWYIMVNGKSSDYRWEPFDTLGYELKALAISSSVFMTMMILVNLAWVRAHQAMRIRQVSITFERRASRRRVLGGYEQEGSVGKVVG